MGYSISIDLRHLGCHFCDNILFLCDSFVHKNMSCNPIKILIGKFFATFYFYCKFDLSHTDGCLSNACDKKSPIYQVLWFLTISCCWKIIEFSKRKGGQWPHLTPLPKTPLDNPKIKSLFILLLYKYNIFCSFVRN